MQWCSKIIFDISAALQSSQVRWSAWLQHAEKNFQRKIDKIGLSIRSHFRLDFDSPEAQGHSDLKQNSVEQNREEREHWSFYEQLRSQIQRRFRFLLRMPETKENAKERRETFSDPRFSRCAIDKYRRSHEAEPKREQASKERKRWLLDLLMKETYDSYERIIFHFS